MREPPLSLGAKTVLALRIWGTYARVRAIERHRPLPEVARRLARPPGRLARRVSPDRLGCAVDACLWPVGRPPRCLHSSLVLYRLLRAQGDRPALLVGLMSGTTSHRAHAWVELDGVDVGPPPGRDGHVALGRFGA